LSEAGLGAFSDRLLVPEFLRLANWEKFPIIHGCRRSAAACRTKLMKGVRIENRHRDDDRRTAAMRTTPD
jgi:hypothetical protein